jgi:hypothetical protein
MTLKEKAVHTQSGDDDHSRLFSQDNLLAIK